MSKEGVFDLSPDRLDEHWVEQPRLMFDHMKQLADARLEMDQAKTELDLVESELSNSIRLDPESYGLDKVTEKAIAELIPTQKPYQKAQKALHEARHTLDVTQAFVSALDHRKRALEKLVDLHGMGYFAAPSEKNRESIKEAAKKVVRRKGKK